MKTAISAINRWLTTFQTSRDVRTNLLSTLQGCDVIIPDLQGLFEHWPQNINPEVDRLHIDVERKLESLFPEGKRLQKTKSAGAALFGASWWPYANFETLRIATYLSIWLFAWDDETDSCEFSTLCADWENASKFRAETLDFVRGTLIAAQGQPKPKTPSNPIIAMFGEIGEAIRLSYTPAQIETFLNELVFYIEMTDLEQRCQMSGKLPTVEEYKKRRMGSSAVGVCLAITEYCYGMEIPSAIMMEEDMRTLWNETNTIISTSNDMLSIKKEIAQGQVDTLIPLLTKRYHSPQIAIDIAFETLCASVESFDRVSQQLLARYFDDKVVLQKLERLIDGCKYACTGNLNWSLVSGRYSLGDKSTKNGLRLVL